MSRPRPGPLPRLACFPHSAVLAAFDCLDRIQDTVDFTKRAVAQAALFHYSLNVQEGCGVTKRALYRVLAVLAAVLMLSQGLAGAQQPPASIAAGIAEARELVKARRFQEALAIVRPLAEAHPGRNDILFLVGLAAVEASRAQGIGKAEREALLDESIASFRSMLVDQPGLVRVRLELGRAFFYKAEDSLSKEQFERVLAGNPPAPVVANVRSFLTRIRARRRWNMHLGFALAPDTNIGGSSDERIINIFGLPFRRNARELTRSGVGLLVWGGGEYQYPVAQRLRLRLGMNASRREYSGGRFDRMWMAWHAGPRVFATRNTEFSVLGNFRYSWSADQPDYVDQGARLSAGHRLTRRLTLNAGASWHERRYHDRARLDGPVWNSTVGGRWVLTPTIRLNATAGYGRDRPEERRSRNESKWLQAGVSVALPKGFTVGGGGGFRWTDFEDHWFPFTRADEHRKDKTYNLRLSVFNRALTFHGFSPEVSLIHEARKTNAQAHDYKRTGGELRVVRQF